MQRPGRGKFKAGPSLLNPPFNGIIISALLVASIERYAKEKQVLLCFFTVWRMIYFTGENIALFLIFLLKWKINFENEQYYYKGKLYIFFLKG